MSDKMLGIEIRKLNNQIGRYMETSTHKKCIDSITGTNGWIIIYLAKNHKHDIYQKNLEKDFGITRSTASKVVSLMEHKGLIECTRVPHDARLKKLTLTDKAWEFVDTMREDAKKADRQLCTGFSNEELKTLYSYIQRMRNNITVQSSAQFTSERKGELS